MEELIQEERKEAYAEAFEEGRREAYAEAFEEGRREGYAEGIKEGIEESAILCAEVLTCLKNGDSMESIMRYLSVSEEFVQRLQALLAK
jgi:flagellar biosynthesis/type III secretory pathway protein FliH